MKDLLHKFCFGFLVVGFVLMAFNLKAQSDESRKRYEANTLLKDGGRPTGGFFAPGAKVTDVNGQASIMAGAQMAMVLGHRLNIGIAGYALLSETYSKELSFLHFPPQFLEMGYAGLLLEPVFFDRSVFHLTLPAIIGIGAASTNYYRIWDQGYYEYGNHRADAFFVLEPGANLEVNVAKALRFYAGGSYRFVIDSQLFDRSDQRLSGFSFNFGLKVGWF